MAHRRTLHGRESLALAIAILAVSFGAIVTTPPVAALTLVSGPITVDTIWGLNDTVYVLVGHVTVRPGVMLTILPGTTVRFNAGLALFVDGTLLADGAPGTPISFLTNVGNTTAIGIQFNTSSSGSVSWSTFDRFDRPVTAIESSPAIRDNIVSQAAFAFSFYRSSTVLSDNTIVRASLGVYAIESDIQVLRNRINGTTRGIHAASSGAPLFADNWITNTSDSFAIAISTDGAVSPTITGNTIEGVRGSRGPNGLSPGAPGGDGGAAFGIFVLGAPSVVLSGNTVDTVVGGRGGDGRDNAGGTGGRGGDGGFAGGAVVAGVPQVEVHFNGFTNVLGGRGGLGGGSSLTAMGGDGGRGGDVHAIQVFGADVAATLSGNTIATILAGGGGHGGQGGSMDGNGGAGGTAAGITSGSALDIVTSGATVQDLQGGPGGNSTTLGLGRGFGGRGGDTVGLLSLDLTGATAMSSNGIFNLAGGAGGRGQAGGGAGGNATGIFAFGRSDGFFNATDVTWNSIATITGGAGGPGSGGGGNGGSATGLVLARATPSLANNFVFGLQGGAGGDALGSGGGRGGDAAGIGMFAILGGISVWDSIDTVTKGAAGAGPPVRPSFGVGYYVAGDPVVTSRLTIDNGTIANVDTLDLFIENYTEAVTINTPFSDAKLAVQQAGNLTVRNFLGVAVYWPDGFTLVAGASILVTDNGVTAWSLTSATGWESWLLVTDRVYINSNTPTDNVTEVTVTYLSSAFGNNPRKVDMATTHTETFVMVDQEAPSSSAGPLPAYTTTPTFFVTYTASDGNGAGLDTITLWFRKDGGGWTSYITQPAGNFGVFSFTSVGDGTYEFATTAKDVAGNEESLPNSGNDTWTIVDTTRPGSHVDPLAPWQTSASFLVSWSPDPGVTDIVSYTIQYNNGNGWTNWLVDTTLTSAIFTANPASGVYQFRSIAKDAAGHVEIPPSGNDTWTRIDTEIPVSRVQPLAPWQTTLSFIVSWSSESVDVASYRIDVRDNGGAWTTWIPTTTAVSATYTGVDGHTYEFRSIARDYAGNVELPPPGNGNDTWTRVDVTAPSSAVAGLPTFTASLTISISWAPSTGTTDIATYTIQVSDNGGAWTSIPGLIDTPSQSGTFGGLDGHRYAFRSIAKDGAGNVEAPPAGNDTWTAIDVSAPTTTASLSGTMGSAGWYVTAVTVTLTATDATSGVDVIRYRLDGGPWQTYAGAFAVATDGLHSVNYYATDRAGITEIMQTVSLSVDITPPTTSASLSGTLGSNGWYTTAVVVTLSSVDGASGVASIRYRLDGGAWQTYSGPLTVPADGLHNVDYSATNLAGLVEPQRSVTFSIDTTRPTVVASSPSGTLPNATPVIVVTFSEPMDRASVASAFSITPSVNGNLVWSADNRTVSFVPDRALEPDTTYTVVIDSSVRDLAGNTAPSAYTFQFTTGAAPPVPIKVLGDWWWLFVVLVGGGLAGMWLLRRMRKPAAPLPRPPALAMEPPPPEDSSREESIIEDVFLLYRDGILIKHQTRRLKPDVDTDILTGMLTAVTAFVKDSFGRETEGELDEIKFGEVRIMIGRGTYVVIAAMVTGQNTQSMKPQIQAAIQEIEKLHWDQLDSWQGDIGFAKVLDPYLQKLIRGEYA